MGGAVPTAPVISPHTAQHGAPVCDPPGGSDPTEDASRRSAPPVGQFGTETTRGRTGRPAARTAGAARGGPLAWPAHEDGRFQVTPEERRSAHRRNPRLPAATFLRAGVVGVSGREPGSGKPDTARHGDDVRRSAELVDGTDEGGPGVVALVLRYLLHQPAQSSGPQPVPALGRAVAVSYTHLRAHETRHD